MVNKVSAKLTDSPQITLLQLIIDMYYAIYSTLFCAYKMSISTPGAINDLATLSYPMYVVKLGPDMSEG